MIEELYYINRAGITGLKYVGPTLIYRFFSGRKCYFKKNTVLLVANLHNDSFPSNIIYLVFCDFMYLN